jgi:hypothetical protein
VAIVTELATGDPIDSAEMHVGDSITVFSNEDGIASVPVPTGYHELTVVATGYNTWHQDSVWMEETTIVEIEMTNPVLVVNPLNIFELLCPYQEITLPIFMSNIGNGPLHWTSSIQLLRNSDNTFFEIWDPVFTFDVVAQSGAAGNAGCEFDGTYFYSTRWNSNLMHQYDINGNLVKEFSIPNVSNIRDLAWDGQYLYGGAAGSVIYCFDPINEILIDEIYTSWHYRAIAYDPEMDGFWGNNWAGDIVCSDRTTGEVLDLIPDLGLSGMYGLAYDGYNGRYLWVFDQGEGAGTPQIIYQISISDQALTGISHDVYQDLPSGIAGGLFITEYYVFGYSNIGGLMQGDPGNDYIFLYELNETGMWVSLDPCAGFLEQGMKDTVNLTIMWIDKMGWGWEDHEANVSFNSEPQTDDLTVHVEVLCIPCQTKEKDLKNEIEIFPNPCNQYFTVQTSGSIDRIRLINYVGQEVLEVDVAETTQTTVNTSGLGEGTYVLEATDVDGHIATTKVIIKR